MEERQSETWLIDSSTDWLTVLVNGTENWHRLKLIWTDPDFCCWARTVSFVNSVRNGSSSRRVMMLIGWLKCGRRIKWLIYGFTKDFTRSSDWSSLINMSWFQEECWMINQTRNQMWNRSTEMELSKHDFHQIFSDFLSIWFQQSVRKPNKQLRVSCRCK